MYTYICRQRDFEFVPVIVNRRLGESQTHMHIYTCFRIITINRRYPPIKIRAFGKRKK